MVFARRQLQYFGTACKAGSAARLALSHSVGRFSLAQWKKELIRGPGFTDRVRLLHLWSIPNTGRAS